jgi:PIN domain nuclease of toxin-antitoxin system
MTHENYLLDTHALIFWVESTEMSSDFIHFLDEQQSLGRLYVSPISFWEAALLVKKGRIEVADVHAWKNDILNNTNLQLLEPSATEMIDSVTLPDHHKDPFDRLLIAQANRRKMTLVTRDSELSQYTVSLFWM